MTTANTATTLVNLRDLGASCPGVRPGVLYRSDAPLTGDTVPDEVPQWPPRTVIDLRSAGEVPGGHPLAGPDTEVVQVSMGLTLTPEAIAAARNAVLKTLYLGLLEQSGPQLATVTTLVADAPAPILLHCAAGKDRTGIAIALLLRLVGCSREDIVADYLRSNDRPADLHVRLQRDGRKLPREPALLQVAEEAIDAVLDTVDAAPGGAAGWLATAGGLDPAVVDRLRDRLLLPTAG